MNHPSQEFGHRQRWLGRAATSAPFALLLLIILLVRPFGDFPLNDDWQYARVTKRFIDSGVFSVDLQIAPALFGQSLLTWPVVKVFGFSHTVLRAVTIVMSGCLLLSLQVILHQLSLSRRLRAAILCCYLIMPLTLYFSFSFMTEIYGFAVAFAGAAWWFSRRSQELRSQGGPVPIGFGIALATGFICGLAFWIRQYAALVYPALLGAALLPQLMQRNGRFLLQSLFAVVAGLGVYGLTIWGYFRWAISTGNFRPEFATPLEQLSKFDGDAWRMQPGIFLAYLTVFFCPLLLMLPWRGVKRSTGALCLVVGGGLSYLAYVYLQRFGGDFPAAWLRKGFPYLGNVLNIGGMGPVILRDVYEMNLTNQPRLSQHVWRNVERIIWVASLCWIPLISAFGAVLSRPDIATKPDPTQEVRREVLWFGLLFAAGSALVVIQTYTVHVFDRYLFPVQLGVLLVVAVALANRQSAASAAACARRRKVAMVGAALWVAALSWYTVAGLHDQFRWNEARWDLYHRLQATGVSTLNVNGGWEVQGWMNFDAYQSGQQPPQCIGTCRCEGGWFCRDDSYRIGMNVFDGYKVVETATPSFWLVPALPIYLSRRP